MEGLRYVALAVVARRGDLGMTQEEMAESADVDVKTLRSLEKAKRWPVAVNRSKIEAALKWPSGEMARIRAEGDAAGATIADDLWATVTRLSPAEQALLMRMMRALAEGAGQIQRGLEGQQREALSSEAQ